MREPVEIYEDVCTRDGERLEGLLAHMLDRDGWDVQATCAEGQGGGDGGFDLKAEKGDKRLIIESKCQRPGVTVGRPEILKTEGVRSRESADSAIIVTPSEVAAGKDRDLRLTETDVLCGDDLAEWLEDVDSDGELYDRYRGSDSPIADSPASCHQPIQ